MKILELRKFLKAQDIDLALFFNADANIIYFAGVKTDIACLAIPASGKPVLFVPGFEADRMAGISFVKVAQVGRDFLKTVRGLFPADRIGIIPSSVSYSAVQKVKAAWNAELVDIEDACRDLRLVKTREEIKLIAKACAVTDSLFEELCENMHLFKTELDVATFLKMRMSQFGFEPSFPPIVATGKNGATPHHVPSNSKLSGFTVVDFGLIYKNYCSDITRTVFVGSPTSAERKVYERLLKVQRDCVAKVKPGVTLEQIDTFAHKCIGKSLVHRVGHSLGLEVHDVQPKSWILQPGNVVTIEPGTYGKFGIRIEDDVLVAEKGPVLLTRAPKGLIVFGR